MARHPVHGRTGTRSHRCWSAMCRRFYDGKRVPVYGPWKRSFVKFYEYIGDPPSNRHSIDRKNGKIGYFPGNVRWATSTEQQRNRRSNRVIRFRGKSKLLIEWAEELG